MHITFTDDKKGNWQSVTATAAIAIEHPDYNAGLSLTAWGESEQQAKSRLLEALEALRAKIPENSAL